MTEQYENRFGGIKRLYGSKALSKFQQSHVCVIGIGGVGSWVVEALARSGIGQITLIDMDDICVTNTNRQVHALADTIGQTKIEAMAARC
ncbi:MAG: ThiF family adenylyltransferase, partial [Psychromonas sp.]